MRTDSVRWGRILTGVFLAAALGFAALLLFGQWRELQELRARVGGFGWRISAGWLIAALGLATLDLFLMGAAWVRLYRGAGGTVSFARGIRVWMGTNLGRYIPGKIWHLSGLALHLRRTGESGALALTTALAYQVVTLLTGSAVAVATLGADLARIPVDSPLLAGAAVVLLAGLLHPRVVGALTRLAARLTGEDPDALGVVGGRELGAAGLVLTAAWGVYGAGLWCLLEGLARDGAPAGALALTGIFAASYVAGYLVLVAPGGLVVREGAMTALLVTLTPLGAAVSGALAIAARIWVATSEVVAFAAAAGLPAGGPGDDGSGRGRAPVDGLSSPGGGARRGRDPRRSEP